MYENKEQHQLWQQEKAKEKTQLVEPKEQENK